MDILVTDVAAMEPMLPEKASRDLEDIAFDLTAKASSLAGQVSPLITRSIGDLVRSMNCYYSNLIEGHNTHPRDIDRALRKDLSSQPKKRELQLEAVAHIEVQKAIDLGKDDHSHPLSSRFAMWLLFNFLSAVPAPRWQRQRPERHCYYQGRG